MVSGATTVERAADRGIVIQNSTGDFTFGGPVTVSTTGSGDAILLDTNSGAVTFSGTVDIDKAGEDGIHINGLDPAGSVTFGSSLTIDETVANGLHVSNTEGPVVLSDVAINDAGTDGVLLDNVDQFTLTGNGMTAGNTVDIRRSGDDAVEIVDSNADITGIKITDPTDGGIVTRITGATSRVVNLTGNIVDPPGGIGIEIALESGSTGSLVANLAGNDVDSVGDALNVHTDAGSTGNLELALSLDGATKNAFGSTNGAGIIVDGSAGGGELFVTDLRANVEGNQTTNGAVFTDVVFDANGAGGGVAQVTGDMGIGTTGGRVNNRGLYLDDVAGNLRFSDLDIANDGGTGLEVDAKTSAFIFETAAGSTVDTINGTAIDLDPLTTDVTFDSVSATNGPNGIILDSLAAGSSFTVTGDTDVTGTSGSAILIRDSEMSDVDFANVTIDNLTDGTVGGGVELVDNTGTTVDFNGDLSIETTTGVGFSASNGGTVTATTGTNSINSTEATALSVTNGTVMDLAFDSVSSGNTTAAAVGIEVDDAEGTLDIDGGTVQGTTNSALLTGTVNSGTTISFDGMTFDGGASTNILATNLEEFTLSNSTVNLGTDDEAVGLDILQNQLPAAVASSAFTVDTNIFNGDPAGADQIAVRVSNDNTMPGGGELDIEFNDNQVEMPGGGDPLAFSLNSEGAGGDVNVSDNSTGAGNTAEDGSGNDLATGSEGDGVDKNETNGGDVTGSMDVNGNTKNF